jgi:diguanylate cyclase (GGDEF)-like protein
VSLVEASPAPEAKSSEATEQREHPRTIGWLGTAALAMGGSNQSLFIFAALFGLTGQGSAAVGLLIIGVILGWMAMPGWIELILMWPNRVGGIAATCAEAFRPYSPVLANLTGVCYWWGWIPTCGLTAILSATAIHSWYLPSMPIPVGATVIVLAFLALNLYGIKVVTRFAIAIASASAALAFASVLIPIWGGSVDWHTATSMHLHSPFPGTFGALTSAMAGLYLIGFAAPAFEAAACHVGETKDPVKNVPRGMYVAGGMAGLYFIVIPIVWLGVIGTGGLASEGLTQTLGPTFAPLLGSGAKAAAVWFMVFNMFHGSLQPLAGAARTLSQLSEDGLLPRSLAKRNRADAPWVATSLTALMAIAFLWSGDPPSVIAAANFTYLIGICLPSVAVWLLRRNEPDHPRPWRAPRGTITLGVIAAGVWGLATMLGFEQFGLSYVLLGLTFAYAGSAAYAWRQWRDRIANGGKRVNWSLHKKLTGAMLAVMALDGVGYLIAVNHVDKGQQQLVVVLQDIFVAVALLTVTVGLVLPGVIAHQVNQVAAAARRLANDNLPALTHGLKALGEGRVDEAHATEHVELVRVRTSDEVGAMAETFNAMQEEIANASRSLDAAAELQRSDRAHLQELADHDPLTGLLNRRRLEDELRLMPVRRGDGRVSALVLIDLDNFKLINDGQGHAVGDAMLQCVARLLRDRLRHADVLARLGGDEFAVILRDVSADEAQVIASDLVNTIRAHASVIAEGRYIRITASAGVAVYVPENGVDPEQLLIDADVAMYDAKDAGRDRVSVLDGSLTRREELRTRQHWLQRLREAIEEGGFELHAQPILSLGTGATNRHELLLRLHDGQGDVVSPSEFLGLAERFGMITDIDLWVVSEAINLLREANAAGLDVSFEVNVSGPSLTDPRLIDLLERELATNTLRPGQLILEVTETAAIVNMDDARVFAERLRGLGCLFALDDFGAGFGSFHYLKHLPFDFVKIDGEFIRDVVQRREDQAVVQAIVDIAHALGMQTIAEFVGDDEAVELLRAMGVDYAQGYHIGRPVSTGSLFRKLPMPRPAADDDPVVVPTGL